MVESVTFVLIVVGVVLLAPEATPLFLIRGINDYVRSLLMLHRGRECDREKERAGGVHLHGRANIPQVARGS